jgi:hypothetical protein
MKCFCIILVILILSQASFAQMTKDSAWLSKQQIVGTWQRNDSLVGSGLGQNFQFFADNSFVFNVGSEADDVRDIIELRGKYRLLKDAIYFTITSRKVVEGSIEISDPGISLNIFNIAGSKIREVPEKNPKEMADPCYITLVSKSHIKIAQEQYYKVK